VICHYTFGAKSAKGCHVTETKKPNILICFQLLDVDQRLGGAEVFSLRLAQGLRKRGYNVTFLAGDQSWRKPYMRQVAINHDIFPVMFFPSPDIWLLGSMIYLLFTSAYLLLGSSQVKVIQINSMKHITSIVAFVSKLAGKRVILRSIGGDIWLLTASPQNHPLLWLHLRFLRSRLIDKIVSQSSESTKMLVNLGISRARITQIPNGVDTIYFKPAAEKERYILRSQLGIREHERIVCCVNGLYAVKRVDVILKAFAILLSQNPNVRLIIVGDGVLRNELESLAISLDILNCVQFVGNIKDPAKYLRASDVFVLASDQENQSNALIEAMACGLPVVATEVGGNKECIQSGMNGLLVKPASPHEIAGAIQDIFKNVDLAARLGAEARLTALKHYSFEKIMDHYQKLYDFQQSYP